MDTTHVFNILTLFPDTVGCFFAESIIKRSIERGVIAVELVNIRDFSSDSHRKVDDYPFGGGRGMLLMPDPLFRALEAIDERGRVIYLNPRGRVLNQPLVRNLASEKVITLICGHYEGIDERVVETFVDEEVSIGDYVLTGGEIAAAVLVDAVSREIDETLGNNSSRLEESFDKTGLLEYDQYTRPSDYRGMKVPDVLLSGDHKRIEQWRMRSRLANTLSTRPELLNRSQLNGELRQLLHEVEEEKKNERRQ
jgi:tRNA (guanine37-N1)-methyltransferase